VAGDIRDRDVVTAVTETALAVEDSRIDILVNNVGDFRPARHSLRRPIRRLQRGRGGIHP
jgi:hypothetical protein